MNPLQRILIVKLSAMGDVVQTLPIAETLKMAFPNTLLGWLVSRDNRELVADNPYIDRVFVFERRRWGGIAGFWRHRREFRDLIEDIRAHRFGVVLDFQGLFRSGLLTFVSGAPKRIGFANARELAFLAYNEKVKVPDRNIHAVDRYALLLRCLGNIAGEKNGIVFAYPPRASCTRQSHKGDRPKIVLAPGAKWANKRWPAPYFAELADLLTCDCRARIILVGTAADLAIGEEIRQKAKFSHDLTSLIGQTCLSELTAVIKDADLVVTNDSGPMHLADAHGVPTLALFGPTTPARTGPYRTRHAVLQASLPCIPCLKRNCRNGNSCMDKIKPCEVLPVARQLLSTFDAHLAAMKNENFS